jgi:hypothetical protein
MRSSICRNSLNTESRMGLRAPIPQQQGQEAAGLHLRHHHLLQVEGLHPTGLEDSRLLRLQAVVAVAAAHRPLGLLVSRDRFAFSAIAPCKR